MPVPTPTVCDRLREADAAYHALTTGASIRSVTDENGEKLEFNAANRLGLLNYIRSLQPFCSDYQATSLVAVMTVPVRFLF